MNPEFLDRSVEHNRSVSVTRYFNRELVKIWHYHEQIELVGIINSSGTRFVGDNIQKYGPDEVILIGKNLPHMWQDDFSNDQSALNASDSEVVAIHLGNILVENGILELPEYRKIHRLIELSKRGLVFRNASKILHKISLLHEKDTFSQFMAVMEIMNDLAHNDGYELLTSKGFVEKINEPKEGRLQQVHDYVMNNFRHHIDLVEAADVAHMNPSSFSRYFKQVHGRTFSQYVNEIRVGYACKLLMEDNGSVAEACFESGYNNISNFNKQFKKIHGNSPKEYRRKFKL